MATWIHQPLFESVTMTAEQKKLTSRQAKEFADLQSGAELRKETGEKRGSVKQSTTQVSKPSEKTATTLRLLNATERQELLNKHRNITTPKSGSKSEPEF